MGAGYRGGGGREWWLGEVGYEPSVVSESAHRQLF